MNNVIPVGRQLLPLEQIALVEPFDPTANPDFKPHRDFKSRIVMLNRDIVLAEMAPAEFVQAHGFRSLAEDNIVTNPAVTFRVETFTPTDSFSPSRAYKTRLLWRDTTGGIHSKLLLSDPEAVIAVVLRGEQRSAVTGGQSPQRSKRTSRRPRAAAPRAEA